MYTAHTVLSFQVGAGDWVEYLLFYICTSRGGCSVHISISGVKGGVTAAKVSFHIHIHKHMMSVI